MTRITFLFETLSGTFQIDLKLKHKKNRIVRGGNFQGMVLIQVAYCSPREIIRLFHCGLLPILVAAMLRCEYPCPTSCLAGVSLMSFF